MSKHYSLKKRLLIYTCLINGLLASALMFAAYRVALEEVNEILDAQMVYLAERLMYNIQPQTSQFDPHKHYHEEDLFIDVWAFKEQADLSHEKHMLLPRQKTAGFYPHQTTDGDWVTYVIPTAQYQIQISQQLKVRRVFALELASSMFLPYLLLLPLLLLASAWLVRHNLQPLEDFKSELSQRNSNDLNPIVDASYPVELLPTIEEMNHLFERILSAQQEQKQFIADAAHELRTPITVLNLQTKILLNQSPDDRHLKNLAQGLIRIQHLVNQLLALAQQDATLLESMPVSRLYINEIAVSCIEQLVDLAMHKNIDIGLVRNERVEMHSVAQSLHSIIFNVLDNAIKYTPEHGVINVSIAQYQPQDRSDHNPIPQQDDSLRGDSKQYESQHSSAELSSLQQGSSQYGPSAWDLSQTSSSRHRGVQHDHLPQGDLQHPSSAQVVLVVEDSGPGLAPAQYSQVLKRFYRVENHSIVGSGLGLAIVDQAIQQLGGQLLLSRSEELGGLKVTITLPTRITALPPDTQNAV